MKKDIEWATLALLLFILFVAALYVIKPFIDAVIVAAFFAYITAPLTNRLERILKSRSISAALVVLLAILPLILLGWQTMKIYSNEFSKLSDIKIYTPILQNIDWTGIYSSILSEISNRISPEKVIQGIGIGLELFLKFFIVLVGSFYLLRERVALRAFLISLAPSSKERVIAGFLEIVDSMFYGLFIGHFATSLLVGLMAGIGFYEIGVAFSIAPLHNYAIFFAAIVAILTLFPVVGAWMVYLPISIFLFLTGDTVPALAVFIFGIGVLTVITDVFIRPFISGKRGRTHPFIVLLGFLGGPLALGPIGLIIGPAALALFKAALDTYRKSVLEG